MQSLNKRSSGRSRRLGFKRGITLTEILLAAVILAIAGPALILTFMASMSLNEGNRNTCMAMNHAQYIIEEIKDAGFDDIAANITSGVWDWGSADLTSRGLSGLTNEAIDTQVSGTDLLDITVLVTWDDRNDRARDLEVETLIAQPAG